MTENNLSTSKEKTLSELLEENFDLILQNADKIINNEKYFYCYLYCAYVATPYFGPNGSLPFGGLLMLWKNGKLIVSHEGECNGKLYLLGGCGSPLSGGNSCEGYCTVCKRIISVRLNGNDFADFRVPAQEMLKKYPNKQIIEKGKRPLFSWKDGLKGESTPDKILVEKIVGLSIKKIIEELKNEGREDEPKG